MKKVFLFATALLCMAGVYAQSLKLTHNDKEISDNLLYIQIDPEESYSADFIHITNITDADITFRIELVKESIAEGALLQMCFDGICLDVTTSKAMDLAIGQEYKGFDLLYTYETGEASKAVVNFIDDKTNEVLYSLTVIYSIESGINVAESKTAKLFVNALPNPSANGTTFTYFVPDNYKKACLTVRNSLGSIVKKIPVKVGSEGKLSMSTADFANGIYFYSVEAGGNALITKKLIVKH